MLYLLLTGCEDWEDHTKPKTIIQSVYYHEKGRYSVSVMESNRLKMVNVPGVVLIVDKDTDHLWYECDYKRNSWNGQTVGNCYIHIRSVNDINTAGWNHGKFGSGTTIRIQ